MKPRWNKTLTDWQKYCVNAISTGLLEHEAQQLCLGEKVEIDKCKAWVSKNKYPFGSRENHPYQVWLKEIKLMGEFLLTKIAVKHYQMWRQSYKKPRKINDWNQKRKTSYNPDQLSLF